MKILFCINTMTKGGAERVVSNLSNHFIKKNEVAILTMLDKNLAYELNNEIDYSSMKVTEKKRNIFGKILSFMNTARKYIKYIKSIKPDVIVSFLPYSSFYSIIAGKCLKIPVIVSIRNDPKIEYKSKINYFLMKLLYKHASAFVFQTEDAKKYFNEKIQNKSTIIANSISEEFITKIYNGERKKEVVTVGRLENQKNHKMLINAFAKLSKDFEDYKLLIYGEGTLKENLTDQIKSLHLEDKVFLPGRINNVKEKIYDASLFVLSSNYEGMPNALIEAMSLGLPCISTDCPCGGPKALIENETNGILVKVGDEEELKNKIELILSNKELQTKISENANKIQEILAPKKINQLWEDYIVKTRENYNVK